MKKYGWQKKSHSYGYKSDSLSTVSQQHHQEHAKTQNPTINGIIPSSYSLRRTNSNISNNKNKNNKKNLIEEYKVPPATDIIHERHARMSDPPQINPIKSNKSNTNEIPSLFTSLSKYIVKDRMPMHK
eukprot:495679_1